MKILIVGLMKSHQLVRVREEAELRGHVVEGCYTSDLILEMRPPHLSARLRDRSLSDYDLVFFWALDRRKHEWYLAAQYLNTHHGIPIVDQRCLLSGSASYASPALEYRLQVKHGLRFPRSAMLSSRQSVSQVIDAFEFPLIVKGSQSRQGRGVYMVYSINELQALIDDKRGKYPSMILREYIPNDGDVRIFTVGYKAIGAMKRSRVAGDFRSNISQGATGSPFDLEKRPDVQNMAEKLSKVMGIEVAGVDIMLNKDTQVPYILEINPGPELAGIERYTKTNAAREIVLYFEKLREFAEAHL